VWSPSLLAEISIFRGVTEKDTPGAKYRGAESEKCDVDSVKGVAILKAFQGVSEREQTHSVSIAHRPDLGFVGERGAQAQSRFHGCGINLGLQ
jgi:hypothetical protein